MAPSSRPGRAPGHRRGLLIGLLHGAADALPVSSSGHVAAAEALLRAPAPDPVGLHAGSLAAIVVTYRDEAWEVLRRLDAARVALHLAAGGIPAAAGFVLHHRDEEPPLAHGLVIGAALLLVAGRRRGTRGLWEAGPADGVWLGLAQAAALWPGVSRNGATLAAARLRGFAPDEANRLSREIGAPVTLGAVVLRRAPVTPAAVASFLGVLAARPMADRLDRGAPLWPYAVERLALAAVLLARLRSSPA